jgi:hypothetical protein
MVHPWKFQNPVSAPEGTSERPAPADPKAGPMATQPPGKATLLSMPKYDHRSPAASATLFLLGAYSTTARPCYNIQAAMGKAPNRKHQITNKRQTTMPETSNAYHRGQFLPLFGI